MRPMRTFARTVTTCCLAGCAGAATAQVDDASVQMAQTLSPSLAPAASPRLHAHPVMQTMLWRQGARLGFGIGVEQQHPDARGPGLQPRAGDAILLGVSFAAGERTRLTWQTSATDIGSTALVDRPMKVSLTFQRRDSLRELRRGSLMRMELSGQTTLALKARGGRLGFALTSTW